jgi:hypothetical protein
LTRIKRQFKADQRRCLKLIRGKEPPEVDTSKRAMPREPHMRRNGTTYAACLYDDDDNSSRSEQQQQ